MSEQKTATLVPAPAVTTAPVSDPSVITTPSTTPNPVVPEGKVTIPTAEFAQLQRDAARGRSAQRRNDLNRGRALPTNADGSPNVDEAVRAAEERAEKAERSALQAEVRVKTRELLDKDEFKNIPKSTKDLILKNPGMITGASSVEEALLDIEDYVRDNVITIDMPAAPGVKPVQPAGHSTPAVVTPGAPAEVNAEGLEDLTKLSGPARSTAAIRNVLKKSRGVQG